MQRTLAPAFLLLALAVPPAHAAPPECPSATLTVLAFNIEYGGDLVSFAKVVEVVRTSGAEIVGIEEAWGHVPRLAKELGWPSYDARTHVLSKFPIVGQQGVQDAYDLVEVSPGCVVGIGNVHLPSYPSGEDELRAGKAWADVVGIEQKARIPPITAMLNELTRLGRTGVPVFLTGDFNAPSHKDKVQPWPVSLAVDAAGFKDSYRDLHPDAEKDPGFTWWAGRPPVKGWNPDPKDPQTRIDYVYSLGEATATSSRILGEKGKAWVDIPIEPWPADHRAVVTTFTVKPGPLPTVVAVPHQVAVAGTELEVQYHAPAGSRLVLVPVGTAPETISAARPLETGAALATLRVATTGVAPGAHEAVIAGADGTLLARQPYWIVGKGAKPTLTTTKRSYKQGEPIVVRWANAPGNRWDWVGLYPAVKPDIPKPLLWRHTKATVAGEGPLDGESEAEVWPLLPGKYSVKLLLDDGYTKLAESAFEVVR
jgi:hypothetical protein